MSSPPSSGQAAASCAGSSPQQSASEALASLGCRLRQAREAQALEASDLADRLRIGVEQLEALESADPDRLPEQVFVIAQARRVAGALQIDVSAELEALRRAGAVGTPAGKKSRTPPIRPPFRMGEPPAATANGGARRAMGLGRPVVLAGACVLLLAALWGGWRWRLAAQGPADRGQSTAAEASRRPGTSAPSQGSPAQPTQASSGPQSAAAAVAAGKVVLQSREPSWVEVRRPDGVIVFRGLLRGARVFPLGDGLQVLAGRPDLVTSRVGAAPAQVLGPISDVRWRSLTAPR